MPEQKMSRAILLIMLLRIKRTISEYSYSPISVPLCSTLRTAYFLNDSLATAHSEVLFRITSLIIMQLQATCSVYVRDDRKGVLPP
uniref:Putative secreted peptide n=1 Tax=Anopheles braziliensis TaxID=58242 RepID=A0A2M3ZNN5_9DIPT